MTSGPARWHAARARRVRRAAPELRQRMLPSARTSVVVAALVAILLVCAHVTSRAPWFVFVPVAWVCALFSGALWSCVHECAHDLVFRRRKWDRALAMLANIVLIVPAAEGYRHFHGLHHAHTGDAVLDLEVPARWESVALGGSVLGRIVWIALLPGILCLRTVRIPRGMVFPRLAEPLVLNAAVQGLGVASVGWLLGTNAILFLFLASWLSLTLHPLGARWVQEHGTVDGVQQPTRSYYGVFNWVCLNGGYHNEHHDFPSVPWHTLPNIKSSGGVAYTELGVCNSWCRSLLEFFARGRICCGTGRS
jgi:sphingolipid 4-desaturase/C4-monooxygenase